MGADSNRTLRGAGLGTSWDFHPKMSCLLFLALVLPFHLSEAYTVRPGRCPEYVMGMTNFDKTSYLGEWYEYANVFEFYQDLPFGGKCVRATYTNEGDEVGVFNEFVSPVTGYGNIKGSARFANPSSGLASSLSALIHLAERRGHSLAMGTVPTTKLSRQTTPHTLLPTTVTKLGTS